MAKIKITPPYGEPYERNGTLVEKREPEREPHYHINGKCYPAYLVTILEGKAVPSWR